MSLQGKNSFLMLFPAQNRQNLHLQASTKIKSFLASHTYLRCGSDAAACCCYWSLGVVFVLFVAASLFFVRVLITFFDLAFFYVSIDNTFNIIFNSMFWFLMWASWFVRQRALQTWSLPIMLMLMTPVQRIAVGKEWSSKGSAMKEIQIKKKTI